MKNLTTLLTIGLIAVLTRLVMLVPVTSNITPADPNSNGNAPGLASGQNDPHRNPQTLKGFGSANGGISQNQDGQSANGQPGQDANGASCSSVGGSGCTAGNGGIGGAGQAGGVGGNGGINYMGH